MGGCCHGCCQRESDASTTVALRKDSSINPSESGSRKTASGMMTRLAMKFPRIRRSFIRCEKVFKKYAGENESVHKSEMKPILVELGASEELLTDEVMESLGKKADLHGDDKISFKEFLIAAAIGVFLNDSQTEVSHTDEFLKIKQGFEVVQSAFHSIDTDHSGEIDFEELKSAFMAMRSDELMEERLAELDINGDGSIEFPEFIFGMCSWVGMEDDDCDEDNYSLLSPQPNAMSFKADYDVDALREAAEDEEFAVVTDDAEEADKSREQLVAK